MKNRNIILIVLSSTIITVLVLAFFVNKLNLISTESTSRCNFSYKQKNYQQAFSICKDSNLPFDYFILGKLYKNGLGVEKNIKLAIQNFNIASNLGVAKAQMIIGDNLATKKNWGKALASYSKASKKIPFALVRMAEINLVFFKQTKNNIYRKKAFDLIQKAVEAGNDIANIYMGYFYSIGYRVSKNIDQAIEYYKKFISSTTSLTLSSGNDIKLNPIDENNNYQQIAEMLLGTALYSNGQDIPVALNYLLKGKKTGNSTFIIAKIYLDSTSKLQNSQKAIQWLKEAVSFDNTNAIVKLAKIYQQGIIIKKDIEKSIRLFEKAANEKNIDAMLALASIYEYGDGVPVNTLKSQQWYTKAQKLGSKIAENKMKKKIKKNEESRITKSKCLQQVYRLREDRRNLRRQKKPIKLDYAKTIKICRKEHQEGNPIGTYYLGYYIYNGLGIEQNQKKGLKLIEQSADNGYFLAARKMADYYTFGICPNCYYKSADNTTLLKQNRRKAKKYTLQYAKDPLANSISAGRLLHNLARSHWYGLGMKINRKLAFNYYKSSAELGDNDAQYKIAKIYNTPGYTFANFDRKKAIKWFTLAAEKNTKAQRSLCYIYASYPNHIDHKKAYQWCSIAARTNSRRSMYYLATLYQFGLGIKQDIQQAKFWYQKSADEGYELSIKALQNLN